MNDIAPFSDLIGSIYECIREPAGWTPVLENICTSIDADGASIHVYNPLKNTAQIFVECGVDPAWSELGRTTYAAMSPVGAAVLLADLEHPLSVFDLIDEKEFIESRYYREWLAPKNYLDIMGVLLAKSAEEVGAFGAVRRKSKGRFSTADRAFVGLIAPHLRRAVTISGMIEGKRASDDNLAYFMNQLSTALMFVDADGALLRANTAAETLIAQGDIVRLRDNRVRIVDEEVDRTVRRRIAAQNDEPLLLSVTGKRGETCGVSLIKLDQRAGTYGLLVKTQLPETPAVGQFLAHRYSLSPRETAVLMPMMKGASPQEVADTLGVGIATVRTHLSNLFTKTGTTRQAELVAEVYKTLSSLAI